MKKKKRSNQNTKLHNALVGIGFLSVSVVFFISLFLFQSGNDNLFTYSGVNSHSLLKGSFVIISSLLTQTFGLFSYFIALLFFVWGLKSFTEKLNDIRHKLTLLTLFIFFGVILFNILSTYQIIENIIKKFDIPYYAGGFTGYIFSKLIFLDILKHSPTTCKWVFYSICMIWLLVAKKALFISFNSFIDFIPQASRAFFNIWRRQKNTSEDQTGIVWDDSSLNQEAVNEEYSEETSKSPENNSLKHENISSNLENFPIRNGNYNLPNIELLDKYQDKEIKQDSAKLKQMSDELLNVLQEFGINGEILNIRQGPVVTMFEFRPAPGIKTSRVISLSDDIARSMSAISARISTIPGQNAIGIELPNKVRQTVYLRELISSEQFAKMNVGIPIILGKNISGSPIMADLAKMPHLLVAGTTGSGKSVSINDMILSILFKFTPKDCKLIMIDPKMLELSVYDEIPHLLTPVVTDPKKAVFALKWAVAEMESRYRQMSKLGVRNIDGFNKKLMESKEKGDLLVRKVQTGFDQETGRPIFETQQLEFEPMPYIVIIVDEMADLMLVAGKDVESAIQRLAQMARAAGIHLIMATQRPSVDVITGTIKANFPTRISFQVTSKIDSRTILGEQGAEQLLGQGDMLYMSGAGRLLRVHGPFVKDSEVEKIVSYIKAQGEPEYVDVISDQFSDESDSYGGDSGGDDMYKKALEIVVNDKKCSISYIQRKLQIGYNRAARIVEEMEEKGVLSPPNHTGKREILI